MLSQKQLEHICLLFVGDYRQCRYLQEDPTQWRWYCVKHKQSAKDRIDAGVQAFLQDCKAAGLNPKSPEAGVALGDNCAGYPIFKHIEQGYDKD